MDTNYNRIKVADLEKNERDKILTTNSNGELEFSDVNNIKTDSYNALDYVQDGKSLDARQGKVLKDLIDNKVDKITGKSLVSDTEITRLASISNYIHPTNHPPSIIAQDTNNRFVTDTEKTNWNSKQSLFTGITNYITKSLNAVTLVSSRLFDNGIFFGIGTYMIPTKDITLGNQANRVIGIEESNNINSGRDLTVSAGRTINFVYNNNFNSLSQPPRNYWQMAKNSLTNDIYVGVKNDFIYVKHNNSADFVSTGILFGNSQGLAIDSTGTIFRAEWSGSISKWNGVSWTSISSVKPWGSLFITADDGIYATLLTSNDIYYCPSGGSFQGIGETVRLWSSYFVSSAGTHYASVNGGGIYRKRLGETSLVLVFATAKNWTGFTELSGGDIIACADSMYRSVGGTGVWEIYNSSQNSYTGIVSANKNIYASSASGIYLQTNDAKGTSNLDGGTLDFEAGTGKGTGKSRIHFNTGQKTTSGTDMQNKTLRAYIDENGYMIWLNMPTYADNSTAITAGLPVGCEYKTATGDRKIVY